MEDETWYKIDAMNPELFKKIIENNPLIIYGTGFDSTGFDERPYDEEEIEE